MSRISISLLLALIVSGCIGGRQLMPKEDEAVRIVVTSIQPIHILGPFKVISAVSAPVLLFHAGSNILLPPREEELTQYAKKLAEKKLSVLVLIYGEISPSDFDLGDRRFESIKDTLIRAGVPGEQVGHAISDEFPGIGTCPHSNDCVDLFVVVGLTDPSETDAE